MTKISNVDGRSNVLLAVVRKAATAGYVVRCDAAPSAGPGEILILREAAPIHDGTLEPAGIAVGEPTPHGSADHSLAEERLGQKTLAISPLRVLLAPVVEGDAMLALSRVRLRFVPILEAPTLSVDPAKLSLPLDVGGADPKLFELTEPAADSPLDHRIRDDRQLTAGHLAHDLGALPVGPFRVIQVARAARNARAGTGRAGRSQTHFPHSRTIGVGSVCRGSGGCRV